MISQKFRVQLPHGVNVIVTLSIHVKPADAEAAERRGIGPEELKNLVGQEFQRMAADAGLNADPGGI